MPESLVEMVEETYGESDLLLLNTDQQTLRAFAGHISLDAAQTDHVNKRQLLKKVREFVEAFLNRNTEATNVKKLNEWLQFLRRRDDNNDGSDALRKGMATFWNRWVNFEFQ